MRHELLVCACGKAGMARPADATPKTRYQCAACSDEALRRRGISTANQRAHALPDVRHRPALFGPWRDRSEMPER